MLARCKQVRKQRKITNIPDQKEKKKKRLITGRVHGNGKMNMKKEKLFELEMPQSPCESRSAFTSIFVYCNINRIVNPSLLCHVHFFYSSLLFSIRDNFSLFQNKTR